MALRKSTRVWLALFALAIVGIVIDGAEDRLGFAGVLCVLLAWVSGTILAWRGGRVFFRALLHRLTLRLAFSYFLIGVLPIPLLAALAVAFGFLLSHEYLATRARGEIGALVEIARASGEGLPRIRLDASGRIASSDLDWARPGTDAPWARGISRYRTVVGDGHAWIAIPMAADSRTIDLLPIQDPSSGWLQRLADRTGYDVAVEVGSGSSTPTGYQVKVRRPNERSDTTGIHFVSPQNVTAKAGEKNPPLWHRRVLIGVYLERAIAASPNPSEKRPVVALLARSSPAALWTELSRQGVPEVQRVLRRVLLILTAALLCVYLVALAIAFILVAAIVRNVNRLTRATDAVGRGDFSVRVNSKSRDQIGDLARSFDGMAASIERLLRETAEKEKLEAELAVARAIQESFLPESGIRWAGFRAVAHFEPVADLGGDYYDILPMPDGRTGVAIGDVSGHGVPTGLLAAAARATLGTLVDLGVPAPEAFRRLGERTQRRRDSGRHLYTTLAFFAYDAAGRRGTLTNAGHPAPYRIGAAGAVERLALPALPIGLLPERANGGFPSREIGFGSGDRLVFFTDGVVEAADANEEPFGYERFEALLAREAGSTPENLVRSVLDAVARHVGTVPLEDDRTLLVLSFD